MSSEKRDITGDVLLMQEGAEKYLTGRWTPFDSPSVLMSTMRSKGDSYEIIRFREVLSKRAFVNVRWDNTLCVANHDENNGYIARYGVSLDITTEEDGMYYRAQMLESDPRAKTVMDYTLRGDYKGNSFAFVVDESTEKWERQVDGTYLRTVHDIPAVYHVGPVFRPAYQDTTVTVSSRSLETIENILENQIRDLEKERSLRLKFLKRAEFLHKVYK